MPILSSVLSWLIKKRIHQIELFLKYPQDVQNEWFKKLISTARDTEWGKRYDYAGMRSLRDFQERVPISEYQNLQPYIERLMKGEQNLLWPSDIKWFAKSSGTTGSKSKFIPVSQESLEECHYSTGKDMLTLYHHAVGDSDIFKGKALGVGGSHDITTINNESYLVGDLSAILMQNLPFWAELKRTPNLSIALMDEWESKIEKMARVTSQENVTNISGVPSWMLLLLRRILEITGKNHIHEVWPNLEVFFHGGVSFLPYRAQFDQIIQRHRMHYFEVYNASEGFFGIQDRRGSDEMLLMLDYGIFYEFMPMDQLGQEHPKLLTLDQVERGENYALVISTNAGLWRYLIGDTITFTSTNPYRIRITGRTKSFINAFGEEVIVDNADKAFATACRKCDAVIEEYTGGPVFLDSGQKARHEWFVEFRKAPQDLDYFSVTFDNALKSLNSDYEAKRYRNMILQAPDIRNLPKGTFYEWLKIKGKLGGQHKVPRLSNNSKILDEIKSILHEK